MARVPSNFRQQDVARALKAAKAAGLDVIRYYVDPRTSLITVTVKNDDESETKITSNPFDNAPTTWPTRRKKKKCASE